MSAVSSSDCPSLGEMTQANGFSKHRAHTTLTRALTEVPASQVDQHVAEELLIIDDAINDLLPTARQPQVA